MRRAWDKKQIEDIAKKQVSEEFVTHKELDKEVEARKSADASLSNSISDEAKTRLDNDNLIMKAVDTETQTRYNQFKNLDDAVQSVENHLATETVNRQNADTTIQNNLSTETTNRQNADNTLQNNINTVGAKTNRLISKYDATGWGTSLTVRTTRGHCILALSMKYNDGMRPLIHWADGTWNWGNIFVSAGASFDYDDGTITFSSTIDTETGEEIITITSSIQRCMFAVGV